MLLMEFDSLLAVVCALGASALLLSVLLHEKDAFSEQSAWMEKRDAAESIAGFVVETSEAFSGDRFFDVIGSLRLVNASVHVGAREFGDSNPLGASASAATRLVFVSGEPALVEVKVW